MDLRASLVTCREDFKALESQMPLIQKETQTPAIEKDVFNDKEVWFDTSWNCKSGMFSFFLNYFNDVDVRFKLGLFAVENKTVVDFSHFLHNFVFSMKNYVDRQMDSTRNFFFGSSVTFTEVLHYVKDELYHIICTHVFPMIISLKIPGWFRPVTYFFSLRSILCLTAFPRLCWHLTIFSLQTRSGRRKSCNTPPKRFTGCPEKRTMETECYDKASVHHTPVTGFPRDCIQFTFVSNKFILLLVLSIRFFNVN